MAKLLYGKVIEMSEFTDFEEEITRLRDRMNQLFSDLSMEVEQSEPLGEVEWSPLLDILENKDDIIIKADIPGVNSSEIDLSISGDILRLRGERKREVNREDENYHNIERGYGKFDRRIPLPTSVDIDGIKASYKDGVLTVYLPKLAEDDRGKIQVGLE